VPLSVPIMLRSGGSTWLDVGRIAGPALAGPTFLPSVRRRKPALRNPPLHVLVVESDPQVARDITALALVAFPRGVTTVLATTTSAADARLLIDRLAEEGSEPLLVICATKLADGQSGLDVLEAAKARHPRAVGVVITSGEREEFVEALRRGAHGIVSRSLAMESLTQILRYLAEEARTILLPAPISPESALFKEADDVRETAAALERALDSVEVAAHRLRGSHGAALPDARRALEEAERLAVQAHRRVLDAQRALRPTASSRAP
jgi:DNA-binding NarL/FixJ family response regulator